MRILKLFKKHILALFAAIVLIVISCNADLALPTYMSDIVDVGVQQGGIASPVPDTIRAESLDDLELFMSAKDAKAVEAVFSKADKNGIRTYKGTEEERADGGKIADIMSLPETVVLSLDQGIDADSMGDMMGSSSEKDNNAAQAMPNALRRPVVVVVPGGGYNHVSAREADPVALQFAAAGYHTAVLTYSVGEGAQNYQPLRQLNEALALLRQNAGEWHILPDKIAVCGFSAGGHLALSGAVLDIPGETAQQRPNAVILGYPVITAGEFAHRGSFVRLAGSEDAAAQQGFTLEDQVNSDTPPVFVWHTMEDKTVPVENTLLLLAALRRADVPCEAHLFEKGAHGTSISTAEVDAADPHRAHWVALCLEWLGETFGFKLS